MKIIFKSCVWNIQSNETKMECSLIVEQSKFWHNCQLVGCVYWKQSWDIYWKLFIWLLSKGWEEASAEWIREKTEVSHSPTKVLTGSLQQADPRLAGVGGRLGARGRVGQLAAALGVGDDSVEYRLRHHNQVRSATSVRNVHWTDVQSFFSK